MALPLDRAAYHTTILMILDLYIFDTHLSLWLDRALLEWKLEAVEFRTTMSHVNTLDSDLPLHVIRSTLLSQKIDASERHRYFPPDSPFACGYQAH